MPPKAPAFWYQAGHPAGLLLAPLGFLYGLGVQLRFLATKPYRSKLPVICIGNLTLGGAGKTPLAIELCRLLQQQGLRPVFLTRGYGGSISGAHPVDPEHDDADMVGDEPLLLARHAPVVVSADRPAGARLIEKLEADVIIMDDGFQNPTLQKDLSLIVVDAVARKNNGHVFPAGPLRAPLGFQLARADAFIFSQVGDDDADMSPRGWPKLKVPSWTAEVVATGDTDWLAGMPVISVCGIANPAKFHGTLKSLGAEVRKAYQFPDHHPFSDSEAQEIVAHAQADGLSVVITEKDWVRLSGEGACGELKRIAKVLPIRLLVHKETAFVDWLRARAT